MPNTPAPSAPQPQISSGFGQFVLRLVEKFPQWFVASAAVIYGTGFLVVLCFDNYMGIRGAVVEGLKAKYMHVGILCVQFPVSIGVILLGTVFLHTKNRAIESTAAKSLTAAERDELRRQTRRKIIEVWMLTTISSNILLFFYLLSTFARGGHFSEHERGIAIFFLVLVLGIVLMAWQRGLFAPNAKFKIRFLDPYATALRVVFAATSLIITIVVFWSMGSLLWEMVRLGGYLYIMLLLLIGELIWRIKGRFEASNGSSIVFGYAWMALAMCAALFYLSTLIFAYRVYPYIPVSKGGGDYTGEPLSILRFESKYRESIPDEILDSTVVTRVQSKPIIIIEETDTKFFVAKVSSSNNPVEWRKPGRTNKPAIVNLRRETVTSVESVP